MTFFNVWALGVIKRSAFLAVFALACTTGQAPARATQMSQDPAAAETPRLLVFLVVDQLRADILEEYRPLFDGGLRRLLDDGLSFTQATHTHAVTETSPGHATLSTGTHPSRHGMVSNQWFERSNGAWRSVLNVEHESHSLIGDSTTGAGAPERLMRTGVADWLRGAHPDAQVVSLSGKARAAVLLAGKTAGDVYWFDEASAKFSTSTYYSAGIAGWVEKYNDREGMDALADTLWESTIPSDYRSLTRPDTAAGEGDGVHTWFPHIARIEGYGPLDGYWLANNPELDRSVLGLAREAVRALDLGEDATPDYLALGLSAVDRVGHAYGPRSREQLDNLLRLDRELGRFLDFLDDEVGVGKYAVAMSADHGVMDLPEAESWDGRSRRLTVADRMQLEELLGQVVREEAANGASAIATRLAAETEALPWVRKAWPVGSMSESPDSLAQLQMNSFFPGRPTGVLARFGVVYQLVPGTLDWNWPLGTHHGSPYYYDRHVPLVFMGPGVVPGVSERPVETVDIAPTLAEWLGIQAPDDLDGTPVPITR